MANLLTKREFDSVKADFYLDASDAYKTKVAFTAFLKQEAQRERLYGSKRLSNLYLNWVTKLTSVNHKGGIAGAMVGFINTQEITILTAFEESGKLADGFLVAADVVDKINRIKGVYFSKLAYPVFSLLVAFGATGFIYDVFPKNFGAKTPFIGKVVIAYTGFVSQHMTLIVLSTLFTLMLVSWTLPNMKGNIRFNFLDKYIPPYTTYKTFRASAFQIMLSALLKSGMSLDKALSVSLNNAGEWMGQYLLLSKMKLANKNLQEPIECLNVGLLDNRTYFRLETASQKSGLNAALLNMAERGFERVLSQVNANAAIISQIIMAIAGGSIVLMMSGLIQTMFSVSKF